MKAILSLLAGAMLLLGGPAVLPAMAATAPAHRCTHCGCGGTGTCCAQRTAPLPSPAAPAPSGRTLPQDSAWFAPAAALCASALLSPTPPISSSLTHRLPPVSLQLHDWDCVYRI